MTHIINPNISNRQKSIIKGTILGGSSIIKPNKGKNCYLSMRGKNVKWLEYKAFELDKLSSQTPFTIENTNRWHSLCYPIFSELYEEFYFEEKRCLQESSLDLMTDISLSVWYGDIGNYKRGIVTLNTNIWGESGTQIFENYLKVLDYEIEIINKRNTFRIKMNHDSSNEFLRLIIPQLPHWFFKDIKIPTKAHYID